MCCGKIWHLKRQKFACLKVDLSFFEKSYLEFSMVKINFLQKVLKKWSSSEKNSLFFSIIGGKGGSGPYMDVRLPQIPANLSGSKA